jgi:hypothetical protein
MLDMLVSDANIAFTIRATLSLHNLQFLPNLGLVFALHVIPCIFPCPEFSKAFWRIAALQFVHGSAPLRQLALEVLQPN